MNAKHFTPKLPPTRSSSLEIFQNNGVLALLKDSFKIHTIAATGALIQVAVCFALPLKWAMVPASVLLLNSIITTTIQVRQPSENYAKYVVPGRASAQIPSTLTGHHGPVPSSEPLVVFNLGTQPNHPLGILAPGWKEMGDYFSRMSADLKSRKEEYGLISVSSWRAGDRPTNNSMLLTFYFRNVEGLNKFAHDKLHREAWDGYYKSLWQKNIGIYHETFIVRPGDYETVYVNASPVLLGRGTTKAETKEGETYINTLVSADIPALKTQWARLGRDASGAKKTDAL